MNVNYGVVKLYSFLGSTLLIAHWMACLWRLVAVVENQGCNWSASYFHSCSEGAKEASSFQMYIVALYLAVMTISTVMSHVIAGSWSPSRALTFCTFLCGREERLAGVSESEE